MPAVNRRRFVQHAVGGISAAVSLQQFAVAQGEPANPVAAACAEPRLRGSFFDLAHLNHLTHFTGE